MQAQACTRMRVHNANRLTVKDILNTLWLMQLWFEIVKSICYTLSMMLSNLLMLHKILALNIAGIDELILV